MFQDVEYWLFLSVSKTNDKDVVIYLVSSCFSFNSYLLSSPVG